MYNATLMERARSRARATGEVVGIGLFTGLGYYFCYSLLERFVIGLP